MPQISGIVFQRGGLPHPNLSPTLLAFKAHLAQTPVPAWAFGGGGGVSQPTSATSGSPGGLPSPGQQQLFVGRSGGYGPNGV